MDRKGEDSKGRNRTILDMSERIGKRGTVTNGTDYEAKIEQLKLSKFSFLME